MGGSSTLVSMIRRLKHVLYLLLGLSALGITTLIALELIQENSHKFATNIAFLECTLQEVSSDKHEQDFLDAVKADAPLKTFARLNKDWIKGGSILLNWVAQVGLSEDGLKRTQTLRENINNYSGSLDVSDTHSFNRGTLLYKRVFANQKKHSNSSPDIFNPFGLPVDSFGFPLDLSLDQSAADCPGGRCSTADKYIKKINDSSRTLEYSYIITRQCKVVDESVFETERKKSADATKAKQKI